MTLSIGSTKRGAADDRAARYVTRIQQLLQDPGVRSALRSGLGRPPERAVRMHAVVAPWISDGTDYATERAYYTVAALLAAGPRTRPLDQAMLPASEAETDTQPPDPARPKADGVKRGRENLGTALASAAAAGAVNPDRAEAYLHLLVRQTTDGLHRHLPRVVRHLQARQISIDWAQLLRDLSAWPRFHDQIAKRWLQSFHRLRLPSPDQPAATQKETELQ